MGLLDSILGAGGGKAKSSLGQQFGLSDDQVSKALGQLIPALGAGVKKNASSPQGLESLMGALSKGNHEQYLDKPEALGQESTREDGNKIISLKNEKRNFSSLFLLL